MMSKTSTKPSSFLSRHLAGLAVSLILVAVVLSLPETQQALPRTLFHDKTALLLKYAAPISPGTTDFWHTEKDRILDSRGQPVRISGVNWSGLETTQAVPGGLEMRDYRAILRTVKENGFNVVRIPFSNEMVETPSIPRQIQFSNADNTINADLSGLTSIEVLDRVVTYAGEIGLKIILDNHRSEAGSSAQESGLWYTEQFPESAWIEDWTALARRYANDSTVIGMDLRNEPHNADKGGACWDCGGANDWHRAAQRAGNAILAVNPHLLIFVEGVDSYGGDAYWWGGNLEGVRYSPVRLSVPNRLVYSAHEYGPTEFPQPWFNTGTTPSVLAAIWRRHWAYISEAGIAPVYIGEFGTTNAEVDVRSSVPGSEGQWFSELIAFLSAHPSVNWTYWGINGEDRYGIFDLSYRNGPANRLKAGALTSLSRSKLPVSVIRVDATEPLFGDTSSNRVAAIGTPSHSPKSFAMAPASAAFRDLETKPAEILAPALGGTTRSTQKGAWKQQTRAETSVRRSIAASIRVAVSTANQNFTPRPNTP